jgi:hypothetical protein
MAEAGGAAVDMVVAEVSAGVVSRAAVILASRAGTTGELRATELGDRILAGVLADMAGAVAVMVGATVGVTRPRLA